jgi:hypothetical protein
VIELAVVLLLVLALVGIAGLSYLRRFQYEEPATLESNEAREAIKGVIEKHRDY